MSTSTSSSAALGDLVGLAVAIAVIGLSALVALPLAALAFLIVGGVAMDLPRYATPSAIYFILWTACALAVFGYNVALAVKTIKDPTLRNGMRLLTTSAIIFTACPAVWSARWGIWL